MDIISDKIRWYHSIRYKLFIVLLLATFVPLILFYFSMTKTIEEYFKQDLALETSTNAYIIADKISKADYLNHLNDPEMMQAFNEEIDTKSTENSSRILVLNEKYEVVNDSNKSEIGKVIINQEVVIATQNKEAAYKFVDEEQALYVAVPIVPIEDESLNAIGTVLMVTSTEDIFTIISELTSTLLFFIIFLLLLVSIYLLFLSKYLIVPINKVVQVVQKMSVGHHSERVVIKGSDEFAVLGSHFNIMVSKLEQVEQTRAEFVSNVSHELKTPLSSIKVLSDSILQQEDVPIELYVEFFQDISEEVDRMSAIINDLLEVVKLDSGASALKIENIDANDMISKIIKRLIPLARQKSINIIFEEERSVRFDCDQLKMTLAITNLVENAIKYTLNDGLIKVTLDCDVQNAYITVLDTGIGISEEEQSKIFNRFYRVDKTRDRETGGTGLGLAITHSTILLHEGSIRLKSEEGKGSVFTVRVPLVKSVNKR